MLSTAFQKQLNENCATALASHRAAILFNGNLKPQQELAARHLLAFDHGILSASTAFGKTIVCSYLISERKVNTLILLQSKDLLEQWVDELNKFLIIDEEPPVYKNTALPFVTFLGWWLNPSIVLVV